MRMGFSWQNLYNLDTQITTVSLIEVTDKGSLWVWGVCHKETDDLYKIAVRSKDRKILRTIEELLPLKNAKLTVEKKLFDDGIIQEGCELIDYTE